MVGDAKKTFDRDGDADFFESFAEGTVVKSVTEKGQPPAAGTLAGSIS
jgi:hypothetical protein